MNRQIMGMDRKRFSWRFVDDKETIQINRVHGATESRMTSAASAYNNAPTPLISILQEALRITHLSPFSSNSS